MGEVLRRRLVPGLDGLKPGRCRDFSGPVHAEGWFSGELLIYAALVVHGEGVPARSDCGPHQQVGTVHFGLVGDAKIIIVAHFDCVTPAAGLGGSGVPGKRRESDEGVATGHLRKLKISVCNGISMRCPSRSTRSTTESPALQCSLMNRSAVLATSSRSTPFTA